jgi:hypothetical protein
LGQHGRLLRRLLFGLGRTTQEKSKRHARSLAPTANRA